MKNVLKFEGKVLEIFPEQVIVSKNNGKTYIKQECVVEEVDEQYPNRGTFESFHEPANDKAKNKLDGVNEGDIVEITFNMKSNAYNYTPKGKTEEERAVSGSNQIWSLTKISAAAIAAPFQSAAEPFPAAITPPAGESDMPF